MALPKELGQYFLQVCVYHAYGQHGAVDLFFDNTWSWVVVEVRYSITSCNKVPPSDNVINIQYKQCYPALPGIVASFLGRSMIFPTMLAQHRTTNLGVGTTGILTQLTEDSYLLCGLLGQTYSILQSVQPFGHIFQAWIFDHINPSKCPLGSRGGNSF